MPLKKATPELTNDDQKDKKAKKSLIAEQDKKANKSPIEEGKKSRSASPSSRRGKNTDSESNFCYSIIWFIILICFSYKIALICCFWYILLLPCTACLELLTPLTDFLLQCVQFPFYCTKAMIEGRGFT